MIVETIDPSLASNGVYAVAPNGQLVKEINSIGECAASDCIGVALIIEDAPVPQRLMIQKYEEYGGYLTYYWMLENPGINLKQYSYVYETSTNYYLPLADGTYTSTPNLSADYTTWTNGAISDFKGKSNTEVIVEYSTNARDMGTVLKAFNAASDQNQGYTDWYIPALGQLALIYLNVTEINEALTAIEGTKIAYNNSFAYWCSTYAEAAFRTYYRTFILDAGTGEIDMTWTDYTNNGGNNVRYVRDL